MANKNERELKVCALSGHNYKRFTMPSLITVTCTVLRYRYGLRKSRLSLVTVVSFLRDGLRRP